MGFGVVLTRKRFPEKFRPCANTVVLAAGDDEASVESIVTGNRRLRQIVQNYFQVYASGGEFEKDAIIQTVILVINDLCPADAGFVTFDGRSYWEADEALIWKKIDKMFREKMIMASEQIGRHDSSQSAAPSLKVGTSNPGSSSAGSGKNPFVILDDDAYAPPPPITNAHSAVVRPPHQWTQLAPSPSTSKPLRLPKNASKPPPSSFPTPAEQLEIDRRREEDLAQGRLPDFLHKMRRIRKELPIDFTPTDDTVLVAKGSIAKNSPGNIRLRAIIRGHLAEYSREGIARGERARIIRKIMLHMYRKCPVGAFVKFEEDTERYWEVDENIVREKISQAFRNMKSDAYKSSSESKASTRRFKKNRGSSEESSGPMDETKKTDNEDSSSQYSDHSSSGINNNAPILPRSPFSTAPSGGNPLLYGDYAGAGSSLRLSSASGASGLQHHDGSSGFSNYLQQGGAANQMYLAQLGIARQDEALRRQALERHNRALLGFHPSLAGNGGLGVNKSIVQHDILSGSKGGGQNRAALLSGGSPRFPNSRISAPRTDLTAGNKSYYENYSASMVDRIQHMRTCLVEALKNVGSTHDWSHISKQKGIFVFTGMTTEMCDQLAREYDVYPTRKGEISLAALNNDNLQRVAIGLHAVTRGKKLEDYVA